MTRGYRHPRTDAELAQLLRRREARARAVVAELRRHPRPDHFVLDGRAWPLPDRVHPADAFLGAAEANAAAAVSVEALLPGDEVRRRSDAARRIARATPLTVEEAMRLVAMYGPDVPVDRAVVLAAEVPEEELEHDS